MATKGTPGGLLARVANFVRSPAADTPVRNLASAPEEGEAGKQTIKRMIERKARNDAVRQREFSQLRKLREASPAAQSELAARASFFQDSSDDLAADERESTLRKIDDIEAQMSKQWWKGQLGQPAQAGASGQPAASGQVPVRAVATGLLPSQLDTCNSFAPTMPTHLVDRPLPTPLKPAAATVPTPGFDMSGHSGFSNSKMVSVEMGHALSDPVLEDAAIRFANSDDAGAESVLLLSLQSSQATPDLKDIWTRALLDLYRCTGQLANYERLALEFAQRADRVALLPRAKRRAMTAVASPPGAAAWLAPAVLDPAAVLQMQACVVGGSAPVRLDWLALEDITHDAAVALAGLMAQWCDQPLTFQWDNADVLESLLSVRTPVGDRQVPQVWWQLRLNALRVLAAQDEFELVSMDYCITYEVSPPAWESSRCRCIDAQPMTAQMPLGQADDGPATTSSGPLTVATPFVDDSATRVALSGEVMGSAANGLAALASAQVANTDVLVSCDNLVRVDFSAAGSILNWVASAQTAGRKVEFCQLPQLVAAFFNLIGINEHARVTARAN